MLRTQIQRPEDQHRRLRRWARQRGISLAEAVRRCVTEQLAQEGSSPTREERVQAALAVCGRYADRSGPSRAAIEHDRHLADAYGR
ncbi:MAG: CopG family transcriptional regulator [candidate division NC10 bacterium]